MLKKLMVLAPARNVLQASKDVVNALATRILAKNAQPTSTLRIRIPTDSMRPAAPAKKKVSYWSD